MDSRQQAPIAPFQLLRVRMELASEHETLCFQGQQSGVSLGRWQAKETCELMAGCRATDFQSTTDQFAQRGLRLPSLISGRFGGLEMGVCVASWVYRLQKRQAFGGDP